MSMKAKLLVAAATFVTLVFQAQLGQAQMPFLPPFGPIPGQGPSGNPGDISKCLSSVMQVEGCLVELYKSLLSGQFGNIGPACCNAFLAIEGNCLPKLFPSNPLFPLLVRNYCAQIQSGGSATPSPGKTFPAPTP